MLKRGAIGTDHKMSGKHLDRSGQEFAGRRRQRGLAMLDQMAGMLRRFAAKRRRAPANRIPPSEVILQTQGRCLRT